MPGLTQQPSCESAPGWSRWDGLCVFALLLLAVVFFRKVLLSPAVVVPGSPILVDMTNQWYPWRLYGFGMLRDGVMPLWNPYSFCGAPFIANWYAAVFYPPNWIFLALPAHEALGWSVAIHLFLGGACAYAFMRYLTGGRFAALLAAVTSLLSPQLVLRSFAGHLSLICSIVWFPLELLAVEAGIRRRRLWPFVLCGIVFSLQLLAGYPQTVLYSGLMVILYAACRLIPAVKEKGGAGGTGRVIAGCGIIALVAFGCAAVQILPSAEFGRQSSRQVMTYEEAMGASFPPENIATAVLPELFGDFLRTQMRGRTYLWEACAYIGIVPLAFALLGLARRRCLYARIFTVIAAASFLIALGGYTPFGSLLYRYVPGFGMIRGNTKAFFITAYCLSFLAGLGWETVASGVGDDDRWRRISSRLIAGMLLLVAALALGCVLAPRVRDVAASGVLWCRGAFRLPSEPLPAGRAVALVLSRGSAARAALLLCAAGILLLLPRRRPGAIGAVALGLVVFDLWSFGARYVIASPVATCWWPPDIVRFFKSDPGTFRILRYLHVQVPGVNQNMNDRLFSYEGYEANVLSRYRDFSSSFGVSSEEAEKLPANPGASRMASLANVKYLILPASAAAAGPDYRLRFNNGYVKVLENVRVLPRAWVAHRARVVDGAERAIEAMRQPAFDPASEVVIEGDPGLTLAGGAKRTGAAIVHYGPDEVVIRCTLGEPGILILSDIYYPGWTASVDGVPSRILKADCAFRGVALGRGAHEVRFSYRPLSFRRGAMLSALSCVVLAVYFTACALGRVRDCDKKKHM